MAKQNCWEYKKCGREPGGNKVKELGECPAATDSRVNGIHDGKNGGRACWVISGTFCGGKVQGIYAAKLKNCMQCEFYQKVRDEEGNNIVKSTDILDHLKKPKN